MIYINIIENKFVLIRVAEFLNQKENQRGCPLLIANKHILYNLFIIMFFESLDGKLLNENTKYFIVKFYYYKMA